MFWCPSAGPYPSPLERWDGRLRGMTCGRRETAGGVPSRVPLKRAPLPQIEKTRGAYSGSLGDSSTTGSLALFRCHEPGDKRETSPRRLSIPGE
jgi:hypothetical protein